MATTPPTVALHSTSNPNILGSDDNLTLNREILHLKPEELIALPMYDVRPFKDIDEEAEAKKVEALARSIEELGQLDDCEASPFMEDGVEKYALFIGNRRRRAIALINEKRSANAKPLMRVRTVIDRTGKDILRKAWHSNGQREQHTAMDLALTVERWLRETKLEGDFKGLKKAAAWLGVDVATVTQAMRIRKSDDPELMRQVASGRISAQSAFDLLTEEDPQARKEALQIAEQIEEKRSGPEKFVEVKKTTDDGRTVTDVQPKRIANDAVKKGLRQVAENKAADAKAKGEPVPEVNRPPWTRKEISEYFEEKDGPAYGHNNSAVRNWVRYVTEKLFKGQGLASEADKLFDRMVKGSDQGTDTLAPTNAKAAAKRTASGKAVRKDAKPAKAPKPAKDPKPAKTAAAKKPAPAAPKKKTTQK